MANGSKTIGPATRTGSCKAMGLPVVSTSIGVAGLNLKQGKQALISDTPEGLAKKAIKLLKNPKLAEKIGIAGQKFVRENYDWKSIVKLHNGIYNGVLKKKKV